MIIASVLYAIMKETVHQTEWYKNAGRTVKCLTWNAFICIAALVSISRMYFACHFLHQCIFGAGLGVLLARLINRYGYNMRFAQFNVKKATLTGGLMVLLCVAVYGTQLIFQKDPQWSIRKVN